MRTNLDLPARLFTCRPARCWMRFRPGRPTDRRIRESLQEVASRVSAWSSPLLRCNILHSQVVGALSCKVSVDEGNPHYVGIEDVVGSTLVLHLLTSDPPIFDSNAILYDDSARHSELSLPRLVVLAETDNVGFCW